MSAEDGLTLIRNFINKMESLQRKHFYLLPVSIREALPKLKIRMRDKSLSVKAKSLLVAKFHYLENYAKLKIIGFNSNHYDVPC